MIKVLSFGAGVQSTALLLMSCRGDLPKLDCAIFADTGYEPDRVYKHLEWCIKEAKKYQIPVHIVHGTKGGLKNDVLNNLGSPDGKRVATLPYFTATIEGKNEGIAIRQCTQEYKIAPIHKFIRRELLGLKFRQRAPKEAVVEQWMGISGDEAPRAKPSREKWCKNVFPFLLWECDYLNKVWRRYQIISWLQDKYPSIEVPRSACLCCPFHSPVEWRKIKEENPAEFEDACKFDEAIRHDKRGKMKSMQYLHRSCKPLRDVDLRSEEEKGQASLWDNECSGYCHM